jgi:ATP/maltotriose-dependent transcriptional regulator MalT
VLLRLARTIGRMSSSGQAAQPGAPVLISTKLHVPRMRSGMVSRPRLVARLVGGRERKLALLCAHAGWGKTTLLIEWLASPDEPRECARVSLDTADGDPGRFWSYVIERAASEELLVEALRTRPQPVFAQTHLYILALLATTSLDRDDLAGAERHVAEAEALVSERRLDEQQFVALVHVARGRLLERRGDPAGAAHRLVARSSWPGAGAGGPSSRTRFCFSRG